MSYENAEVFVAMTVFGIGAVYVTSQLRGSVNENWRDRVTDTEANLSERARRELNALQQQVQELAMDDQPLPGLASFDPAGVADQAKSFQRTLDARAKVRRAFKLMLRIGWPSIAASVAWLLGTVAVFFDDTGIWSGDVMQTAGVVLLVGGGAVGAVCLALFTFCSQRLSGAEVLATSDVDEADGA